MSEFVVLGISGRCPRCWTLQAEADASTGITAAQMQQHNSLFHHAKQQPVPSQKSNTCDLYEKTHPARDWCLKTSKLLDATSSVAFVFRLRPAASALYESSHIWPFSNISLVSLFSPFHPSDHKSPGAVSLTHNGRLSCAHHFSAMVFRKVAVASRPCAHFRRGTPSHPLPIFGQERSGVSTRRGILLST